MTVDDIKKLTEANSTLMGLLFKKRDDLRNLYLKYKVDVPETLEEDTYETRITYSGMIGYFIFRREYYDYTDEDSFEYPLESLVTGEFDKVLESKLKAIFDKQEPKRKKARERAAKKREADKLKKEEDERKQFERLKKKFG